MRKWWIYQQERFPVMAHGTLILAFSFSAVCFSFLLRGGQGLPRWESALTAFISSFCFFLQLRIADEFKDCEEDRLFRPYRPVPRGLVTLRELGWIAAAAGCLQAALAWWLDPRLLFLLALNGLYLAGTSHEFFARKWLKARPFTYMWTHMLIIPLVDFYATACDWMPAQGAPPHGLGWFLAVSFFTGFVIEFGRKMRSPDMEEQGVQTYTLLWGRPRAVAGWWLSMGLAGTAAILAAQTLAWTRPTFIFVTILWMAALALGIAFLRKPARAGARTIDSLSGLWTLSIYLILGSLPVLLTLWDR